MRIGRVRDRVSRSFAIESTKHNVQISTAGLPHPSPESFHFEFFAPEALPLYIPFFEFVIEICA